MSEVLSTQWLAPLYSLIAALQSVQFQTPERQRPTGYRYRPVVAAGIRFDSLTDAAEFHQVVKATVILRIKNVKYPDWYYVDVHTLATEKDSEPEDDFR